jgi:hypothetical protein
MCGCIDTPNRILFSDVKFYTYEIHAESCTILRCQVSDLHDGDVHCINISVWAYYLIYERIMLHTYIYIYFIICIYISFRLRYHRSFIRRNQFCTVIIIVIRITHHIIYIYLFH